MQALITGRVFSLNSPRQARHPGLPRKAGLAWGTGGSFHTPAWNTAPVKRERHMDAISRRNVVVAAASWREIEHVTSVHHPLLITSPRGSAARTQPHNIWREPEEGQDAASLTGVKICLLHSMSPRAQPRMPPWHCSKPPAVSAESSPKLEPFLGMKFSRTRKNWQTTGRIRWFPKEHKKRCKIVLLPISVG